MGFATRRKDQSEGVRDGVSYKDFLHLHTYIIYTTTKLIKIPPFLRPIFRCTNNASVPLDPAGGGGQVGQPRPPPSQADHQGVIHIYNI